MWNFFFGNKKSEVVQTDDEKKYCYIKETVADALIQIDEEGKNRIIKKLVLDALIQKQTDIDNLIDERTKISLASPREFKLLTGFDEEILKSGSDCGIKDLDDVLRKADGRISYINSCPFVSTERKGITKLRALLKNQMCE